MTDPNQHEAPAPSDSLSARPALQREGTRSAPLLREPQAALPQRGTHGRLERADQPGRPVADHQQRAAQPAFAEPGEKPLPRVAGLTGGRLQPDEHRLAYKSLICPLRASRRPQASTWFNPSFAHRCFRSSEMLFQPVWKGAKTFSGQLHVRQRARAVTQPPSCWSSC